MAVAVSELKSTGPAPSAGSSRSRFDAIDALRGLAALMVVLCHCCGSIHGPLWPRLDVFGHAYHPAFTFAYGYIGVDLFLVLSGFCLSWPFLAKSDRPFAWGVYARKRFRRIYPAYFLTFMALLIGGWLFRHFSAHPAALAFAEPLTWKQIAASLALQMTHLCPVFWTLCLEGRWYVLFPFVLLVARKRSAWPLLPLTIMACLLTPAIQTGILSPLKLIAYLPCFVVGVLAAEVHARPDVPLHCVLRRMALPGTLAFLAVCAVAIPLVSPTDRCGYREVLPTSGLFFFLVLLALEARTPLPQPWKTLQRIGVFSYSLYLVHFPLIELAIFLLRPASWSPGGQVAFWLCACPLALVLLAYLFYLVAEKPFLEQLIPAKPARLATPPIAIPESAGVA